MPRPFVANATYLPPIAQVWLWLLRNDADSAGVHEASDRHTSPNWILACKDVEWHAFDYQSLVTVVHF